MEISAPTTDDVIMYLEYEVLPQLKAGYISGISGDASWGIEGDEDDEDDEDD
ncbi:MAG: hypothetical protein WC262_10585 [Bacteroidales bacterium]